MTSDGHPGTKKSLHLIHFVSDLKLIDIGKSFQGLSTSVMSGGMAGNCLIWPRFDLTAMISCNGSVSLKIK